VKNFALRNRPCASRGICDFETPGTTCGWTTTEGSDPASYVFKVTAASVTDSSFKRDHTTKSPLGHVAYLQAQARPEGVGVSRFTGPLMSNLGAQCFTFWFLRSGDAVRLKLQKYRPDTKAWELIWTNNHTHLTNEWIRVQNLIQITEPIKLAFEVTQERGKHSDLF
jgi:hypothetical protein